MTFKACALFLGALVAVPAMAADVLYTAAPCEIEAKAGSDYLGTLAVATPVTVLQTKGDLARVRVDGWTLQEFPTQLFKAANVRIEYASIDEEDDVKTDDKTVKEVAGNPWVKATVEGWVPKKVLTADVTGLWKAGEERLGQACASCHGAPAANHFTANQWASQLPERGGRTGHSRAGANALMFKYLQEHAKP